MNPSVLILGGSGFIGRSACEQLVRAFGGRARITVPTRRLPHAQSVQSLPGLTVLEADVHSAGALEALLAGQDIVINLIAVLQGSAARFDHVHVQLPRRLAAACATGGVRRLIHVSALGVPDGAAAEAPSRYLRSKAAGEAVLREADLDLTLLRPSVVFGAGDSFLNMFARLQVLAPVMPLACAEARFQPVWVEDVARAIVCCVQDSGTVGKTYELAGPDVLSLAEIVRLAGRLSGHPRPILPLPGLLGVMQAWAIELLPGKPLMSRDNLDSMKVPNIAGGRLPGLSQLGIVAQAMAAVAPGFLSAGQGCARLNAWRAHH